MTEHDDVVDLLHRAVDTTPPGDEQIAGVAAAARRHRRLRRAATAAGVAAMVALVAVVLAIPWNARPDRVDLVDRPAAPAEEAPPVWRDLPASELDPRWGAFSTALDDGVLIWGGYGSGAGAPEGPRDDGAVLRDGSWSVLPDSPLAPRMRMNGAAGWVDGATRGGASGREYWIVGGTGGAEGRTPLRDAAAYRPGSDRGDGSWHELPGVPQPILGGAVVGEAAMVTVAQDADGTRVLYELTPGDREWRTLDAALPPVDPSTRDNSDLHVLGAAGHLVVVGQGEMFVVPDLPSGEVARAEPQQVPPPDGAEAFGNVRGAVADRSGDAGGVIVLLSDGTHRYDLATGEWSRIADGLRPDPPQAIPLVRTEGATVAVDVVGGQVHALADGDDAWVGLPPLDGSRVDAAVVAVDAPARRLGDVVVWGGMGSEEAGDPQGFLLALRPDVASTQRGAPQAAAVAGSYRAIVHYGHGDVRVHTFDVVDGGVHARFEPADRYDAPAAWGGFGAGEPVSVDQHIVSDHETYMRARTGARGRAGWYRYAGPVVWHEGLAATAPPTFTEGTRGFRRVEDADAAAQDLTRYSADIAGADLDFLGWFSPLTRRRTFERNEASVDIWVDTDGRVHRIEEVSRIEPDPTITQFERFDALPAIAVPFDESDDAPVAVHGVGMTLTGCGDPTAADALRQRLEEALDADEDIASYRILDTPTREQDEIDDTQVTTGDDRLFIVAVRLRDGVGIDAKMGPDSDFLTNMDTSGDGGVCSVASAEWLELAG